MGITLGLEGAGLPEAVALAVEAERLGYTDIWSAEAGGADRVAPLAAAAQATEKARLGTAIIPLYTRPLPPRPAAAQVTEKARPRPAIHPVSSRPPARRAMSAPTLQALSGGRFILGLGTTSDIIIGQGMGMEFEKPLTRLREHVEALREI